MVKRGDGNKSKREQIRKKAEEVLKSKEENIKKAELLQNTEEEARRIQEEEARRRQEEEARRRQEQDPYSISLSILMKQAEEQLDPPTIPRLEALFVDKGTTHEQSESSYLPYLKAQEGRAYKNPSIKIEIPDIIPEEFAALKKELISAVDTYKQPMTDVPTGMDRSTVDSYNKVYKGGSIPENSDPNSFAFKIGDQSAFDVQLEQGGISINFSDKGPQAQAIAAAAGMMHDIVDTYNQKKAGSRIKALVIKDYEDDLVAGMAIFCSLACQKKPVEFDNYDKSFAEGSAERVVADLLQGLSRNDLLKLVEDDHRTLNSMVAYVKQSKCSKEDLAGHFGLTITAAPGKPAPEPDSTSPPKSKPGQ